MVESAKAMPYPVPNKVVEVGAHSRASSEVSPLDSSWCARCSSRLMAAMPSEDSTQPRSWSELKGSTMQSRSLRASGIMSRVAFECSPRLIATAWSAQENSVA